MQGQTLEQVLPVARSKPLNEFLEELATRVTDPVIQLGSYETEGRRKEGTTFIAELVVSKVRVDGRRVFILCVRDVTERQQANQALRDSEARYRALVENAPEAILVLDVDLGTFVDANDNAVRFFKFSRQELLQIGPDAISPEQQPDGLPSVGLARGYVERALNGGGPVFEWQHRDADGSEFPCEVRFLRLPSSSRRLIRASITDISERKQAETLAFGERRVLEMIASNAPLGKTLDALNRVLERACPGTLCCTALLAEQTQSLDYLIGRSLPAAFEQRLNALDGDAFTSSAGSAAALGRQVVVADIETDTAWAPLHQAARESNLKSCCSTPIVTAGDHVHGVFSVYYTDARMPRTSELDHIARMTQLAGIAIKRKHDEEALRASEKKFRTLFENVLDGVYRSTRDGQIISANPALVRMLGFDSEEELCASANKGGLYVNPKDRDDLIANLEANSQVTNHEYWLRRKDGKHIVVLQNARLVEDEARRIVGFEGTITDISERKFAETEALVAKERAQVTLASIGDAVITTDAAGLIDYLNPVAEYLSGWENRAAKGYPIGTVFKLVDERTRLPVENPVIKCIREDRVLKLADNILLIGRLGAETAIQYSTAPIRDRACRIIGSVLVFHDVSKERRLRRQLSYQASHDALTGLINRTEFEDRIAAALDEAHTRVDAQHALLYLDLDQFKVINDTWGHTAGDQLLRQITELLRHEMRTTDVIARLGGDEFGLLLDHCNIAEAMQLADQAREAIANHRFEWQEGSMGVSASIGIAPITSECESVASLMSAADLACYAAKDLGRNRAHVYRQGDTAQRHQEMQWVSRLGTALGEERFELFFQPIVPIGATQDERGHHELLLRMRDEDGELVPPDAFIPAAERYNLIPEIDRWVVSQALTSLVCRDASDGAPGYTLAINLSGTSLNDGRFLDFLIKELLSHDLPAGAVCFEITETAAIANLSSAVRFMNHLKKLGCNFSLDDFGSGLSSFTYLRTLPVDYIKIDGQFIQNVARDTIDQSMVEAINKVGLAMGIQTIAERVESKPVLDKLAAIGIGYAQGFHIAPPASVENFPRFVQHGRQPRLRLA